MLDNEIEIRLVDSWDPREIVDLYKAGGWWKDSDISIIAKTIAGSFAFAIAIHSGKAVGMGRVISDGVSDAYIQDLVVLPEYRGLGVGKKLVQSLIKYCSSKGLTWIALIAEPGSEGFYKEIGLKKMKGYTPMLWSRD
jgi:ribosomal protein S18 acetylase RimI-like enzyme